MRLPSNVTSILKFFFGLPLTLLSFFFIGRLVFSSWGDVGPYLSSIDLPLGLLGLLLLGTFYILKSVSWYKILHAIGRDVPFTESYFLMSLSDIRRYIPGNVFAIAARVQAFEKYGMSKKMLLAIQVVELLLLLVTAAVVSIPGVYILGSDISRFVPIQGVDIWIAPVFILLLSIVIVASLLVIRRRLLRMGVRLSIGLLVDAFVVGIISWVIFGLGNYFVVQAFFPLPGDNLLGLSSFFVLSWLIGFLSFFTPMGLGVRELVLTIGLTSVVGGGPAAVSAIIARLFLIVGEALSLGFSYVLKKDKNSDLFSVSWQVILLGVAIASYVFYFMYVSFLRHANFWSGRFDLGNMDQTVWNTIHGRIFLLTDPNGTSVMSRLGVHSDFLLILLSPFYLLWEDARMLLFIQSLILGCGAIFVYLLSVHVLKNRTLSLVFAISYLLNFWVQRQNLYEFHAVALATTLLIATFYFLIKKRYILFSILLFLSVLAKENVFVVSFFFGVYLFLKGKRVPGFFVALLSLIAFYVLVSHIIPAYRPQGDGHLGIGYFEALGDTPRDVIATGLFRPNVTTQIFVQNGGFGYFVQTLFPTGFLSLASPLFLLFAAGDYFINIMSENRWLRTIFFHYGALIVPFVYISSIFGVKKLLSIRKLRLSKHFFTYYILFFAVFSTWMYGVLPGARWQSVNVFVEPYDAREETTTALALIPDVYSVSASNTLSAHLTHRQNSFVLPKGTDSDVIALLMREPYIATSKEQHEDLLDGYLSNFDYTLVYSYGDAYIFVKREYVGEFEVLFSSQGEAGGIVQK